MGQKINILIFLVGAIAQESTETLHQGFTTCEVKGANFESCLDNAIQNGVKFLKNGLQDYNLPPLDPYFMAVMKIGAGAGAVHLEQNYEDVTITGFTDVTVNNSRMDFQKKTLTFSTLHPIITQNSHYDVNGKILMLPVHGKGPCTISIENTFTNHRIEFEEKKNGERIFYSPTSYKAKMHPGHASYQFDNLFDGNKLLGDNINRVINEEWRTIFEDVREGYEAASGNVFLEYTRKIFENVPVNDIFLQ